MATKFTDKPLATLPLTGEEFVPIVQSGQTKKTPVNTLTTLQVLGDLPTGIAGQLGYVVDGVGGNEPMYWDSEALKWRSFSTSQEKKSMGAGFWMVGVGLGTGPALESGYTGAVVVSNDGFSWFVVGLQSLQFGGGIRGISYANGAFIIGGKGAVVANALGVHFLEVRVDTNAGPRPVPAHAEFGGYQDNQSGTYFDLATAYDNETGLFTMPLKFSNGIIKSTPTIQNVFSGALIPDPAWPYGGSGGSVVGVGTQGPVEVRIGTTLVSVAAAGPTSQQESEAFGFGFPPTPSELYSSFLGQGFSTNFIEARRLGSADWVGILPSLVGATPLPGLVLAGLVWGPTKETAVEFAAGSG